MGRERRGAGGRGGLPTVPAPWLKAYGYVSKVEVVGIQCRLSRRAGPKSIERHPDVGVAFLGRKPKYIGPAGACKMNNLWVNSKMTSALLRAIALCRIRPTEQVTRHALMCAAAEDNPQTAALKCVWSSHDISLIAYQQVHGQYVPDKCQTGRQHFLDHVGSSHSTTFTYA